MLATGVAKKTGRNKPGPTPNPDDARTAQVIVRCRPEFKGWMKRYAESKGVSLSDLVDEALLGMARADRFEMPPER